MKNMVPRQRSQRDPAGPRRGKDTRSQHLGSSLSHRWIRIEL